MKRVNLTFLLLGLFLFACNDSPNSGSSKRSSNVEINKKAPDSSSTLDDFAEIEDLIRNVYTWHDNGNPTDIQMIPDSGDSMYIGYNQVDLGLAAKDLEKSNFFTEEFIENYVSIHLAVDKKLKKKEIEWLIGSLPNFGSGAEPWCYCQDTPYDEPNPWSELEINTINLTNSKGDFYWKWGGNRPNLGSTWNTHKYHFKVEKVNGKWKVAYLEGLNLEDFTRVNY